MKKMVMIYWSLILSFSSLAGDQGLCPSYYLPGDTQIYTSILNYLSKSEILDRQGIKLLYNSLRMGEMENPLRLSIIKNRTDFYELEPISKHIEELYKRKKMSRKLLLRVLKKNLMATRDKKHQEIYRRSFVLSNHLPEYDEPTFFRVFPSRTLTYGFEMLTTPLSQGMFYKVLGYNPSVGIREEDGHLVEKTRLIINAAVNGLKKIDVFHFFENLNYIAQYDPILIRELMPGHIEGMFYRPASSAEWDLVLKRSNSYHQGDFKPFIKVNSGGVDSYRNTEIYKGHKRLYRDQLVYGLGPGVEEIAADLSVPKKEKQSRMLDFWRTFFFKDKYQNFLHHSFNTISEKQVKMGDQVYSQVKNSTFINPSKMNQNAELTLRIVRYFPEKNEKSVSEKNFLSRLWGSLTGRRE